MKLIIDIPEQMYLNAKADTLCGGDILVKAIKKGIPLPKGHGDLFDKAEILRFLKCPKYENCDWKNCFDCNESRCINLNNVNSSVPIVEAESENME